MAISSMLTLLTISFTAITGSLAFTPRPSSSSSVVAPASRVVVVRGDDDCSHHHHLHHQTSTVLFDSGGGGLSRSYNDGALFDFHQRTQSEKISDYEGSSTYVNTNELWNLAWHHAFVQNDLADFVPPLTDFLQVLTIGDENNSVGADNNELLEDFSGKPAAALEGEVIDDDDDAGAEPLGDKAEEEPTLSKKKPAINASSQNNNAAAETTQNTNNVFGFLGNLLKMNNKNEDNSPKSSAIELVTYDCILDRGLMAQLLAASQEESCTELLLEATKKIREHGVYILQSPPLDDATKKYLSNVGDVLGLQWEFELDGISDDTGSVSVARKYFVGELPTMGKLANVNNSR
jgi:hypothetical protein